MLAPVPVRGVPGVRSLAQATRYVTVAGPMSGVLAWLRAHPPARLARDGSATAGDRSGVNARGYRYRGPAGPAWASAELKVSVAPGGAGSVVRVDGLVVWLDPTPRPDRATGPRLHVAVAAGCPADHRGAVGVRNANAPKTRLLPTGTPDGGLICQDNGGNDASFALLAARRLDNARPPHARYHSPGGGRALEDRAVAPRIIRADPRAEPARRALHRFGDAGSSPDGDHAGDLPARHPANMPLFYSSAGLR